MAREIKSLHYAELPGLSKKQLSEHHDVLYAGYVKKLGEIEGKVKTADVTESNATYSLIRELKLEETFAANAIRLHEGYFDNLGGDGKPKGHALELIKADFGSYEAWEKEFKALGLAARGWVVLAFDWENGRLYNYLCDVHNQGGIWNCTPLLILDVYEHAYFIDYATARKSYIEAFMENINWDYVNRAVKKARIHEYRKLA